MPASAVFGANPEDTWPDRFRSMEYDWLCHSLPFSRIRQNYISWYYSLLLLMSGRI